MITKFELSGLLSNSDVLSRASDSWPSVRLSPKAYLHFVLVVCVKSWVPASTLKNMVA
jgi:hypothetical protein